MNYTLSSLHFEQYDIVRNIYSYQSPSILCALSDGLKVGHESISFHINLLPCSASTGCKDHDATAAQPHPTAGVLWVGPRSCRDGAPAADTLQSNSADGSSPVSSCVRWVGLQCFGGRPTAAGVVQCRAAPTEPSCGCRVQQLGYQC